MSGNVNFPGEDAKIAEAALSMRRLFGDDERRITHALKVLSFARKIHAKEGGSRLVVESAAALHDIGIHEAERKHGSAAGNWQELEGPPIAREILERIGYSQADVEHVCKIVANHHSAKDIDSVEFRIVWDADWIVNIPEELDTSDKARLYASIERIFKTKTGKAIASELYLNGTNAKQKRGGSAMFCYQCEQTFQGTGCKMRGVCGKEPDTAALQDLLVYVAEGVAQYATRSAKLGASDAEADRFVIEALFTTVTNVNFDSVKIAELVKKGAAVKAKAKALYEDAAKKAGQTAEQPEGPAQFAPESNLEGLVRQGQAVTVENSIKSAGADVAGLRELIKYGLKGVAAYADHAMVLGRQDKDVFAFFHEALDFLASEPKELGALLGMALKVGEVNLKVMGLLDDANTGVYGHPEPTKVKVTAVKGKAILVSGHDLKDLDALLKQTEGKGINVYTHGEMLPCLAYPGLKKYKHLVGNYGSAWQNQRAEFDAFPGAILMTTNCIQKPKETYQGRIFTSGLVQWPGVTHISDGNFEPVVQAALASEGFKADEPEKTITIGFARNTVMSVAGTVIDAVKAGKIKRFFLIGGCDGAKPGRNYYTELAEKVPQDCVILTLACGKYRFNKLEFGDIGGIPRLLDCGQCNDAYSAIQIAVALAGAFKCGVNDLPLSMVLSWYEQKAVCILLTLLHLGVRNIRLGPSLPAFVSPAALKILAEKFNIMPTTTPDADLKAILG